MERLDYPELGETLYYEKLDNGLEVHILPKPGFQKTYAVFSTRYGSIDSSFSINGGGKIEVPDGIAHFLEHKMFEEQDGDVFAVFAAQGASANAFTSFDRTAYLFSASNHIEENVETLLNFVQNPYFTDQNVDKEKGIIGQEIQMYHDHPDSRLYYGLIEALYVNHPIRINIAGTVETISGITKELLYSCYEAFYHPSNMSFFIVGGIDPTAMMEQIRLNQQRKNHPPAPRIDRFYPDEPERLQSPRVNIQLPVSMPKCYFGFKEHVDVLQPEHIYRRELETKLLFDLLFSPSATIYRTLYDEDLISDQFGHSYQATSRYAFSIIGGETKDPDVLIERIKALLQQAVEQGIDSSAFERLKKKRIGHYLRSLNSPEAIANEYTRYLYKGLDYFKLLQQLEPITADDVAARLRDHVQWDRLAVAVVRS